MRKEYMKPVTGIVNINMANTLLAGSATGTAIKGDAPTNAVGFSRNSNGSFWEDEE